MIYSALFERHPDWLTCTLANASNVLPDSAHTLPDGTRITRKANGILWLEPPAGRADSNTEALIVSAGVHGNETAPIEVLNGLVSELLTSKWSLACPLLLILGNPPAMVAGERFLDVNMNRLFNGAHSRAEHRDVPEAQRAALIEAVCSAFRKAHPDLAMSHYDLHTAIKPSMRERFALYPFVPGRSVQRSQVAFLVEAEVNTLLLQHKESTVFSAFSANRLNAESFTVELGKVQPFGQNDLARFRGIESALRRRFAGKPAPDVSANADAMTVFEVVHEVLNTGPAFRFYVPDDVANFTEYAPGTVIWEDGTTRYQVGHQPEAIVFPNPSVPVGQRVGLMIRARPPAL